MRKLFERHDERDDQAADEQVELPYPDCLAGKRQVEDQREQPHQDEVSGFVAVRHISDKLEKELVISAGGQKDDHAKDDDVKCGQPFHLHIKRCLVNLTRVP